MKQPQVQSSLSACWLKYLVDTELRLCDNKNVLLHEKSFE